MAWVAWQWVTWRTCSASRGWLCSGLGGYEVSDRVVRPGRCRQGVGKGSRTMCARAAGRCSSTGTTSIGVMKHRHNDSNAAVLTKMQKEIGDRGRSLRTIILHISQRVRSRVLKGVGAGGLSSRDFHFRMFGMSNVESRMCVGRLLRVTSVRSPPRSTPHSLARVFTSSPLHANVYLRMRREGERSNATHLPRARLVRAPRVYSV